MIYSSEIKDSAGTCIKWVPEVSSLAKPQTFKFKPGLNVLWGRNGCGKTTLLRLLARSFHCEQGGVPVLTETSLRNLMDASGFGKDRKNPYKAVNIKHDGQGVMFFDPTNAVGLSGGGAAFDDDFMMEGLANTMAKGSAGQTTMRRLNGVMRAAIENDPPKVENKFGTQANEIWMEYVDSSLAFLKGTEPKGPPTVLLDEPERSFDLPTQMAIWRWIRSYSQRVQFIVASHCFFALNIPEAHYIELEPGYLQTCIGVTKVLAHWTEESIIPIPKPEAVKRALAKGDKPNPKQKRR